VPGLGETCGAGHAALFQRTGSSTTTYRLCRPTGHERLIRRRRGRIEEHPTGPVREWFAELSDTAGFTVEDYHAELVGLCANCRRDTADGPT
jgi:Fe2+ or Zn2+ uptake regulation protein